MKKILRVPVNDFPSSVRAKIALDITDIIVGVEFLKIFT